MPRVFTSLRRRVAATLSLMVAGVIAVGVVSAVMVNGLHADLGIATAGYRQLRQVYAVGFLIAKARDSLSATPPSRAAAVASLQLAATTLDDHSDDPFDGLPVAWVHESARAECRTLAEQAADDIAEGRSGRSIDLLFARLSKVTDEVHKSIADAQAAADRRRATAVRVVGTCCAFVAAAAVLLGIDQYRRVIRPLRRIGQGVRVFAGGTLDRRIAINGDLEFATLAADFNSMADQLRNLYRDLEQQVAIKSRELIRAERLASVGFLAAGVAHEINNPLGIIAGYGERALRQLPGDASDTTRKAITVMCEEAFRCKEITGRLLSLSRPGPDDKSAVAVATIAEQVVSTVTGLRGDRQITLDSIPAEQTMVTARSGDLQQVLLNLVLNATEAVEPGGHVRVAVRRVDDAVQLIVTDDGRGMTAETVDRVFEPFFTDKRGVRTGTGLGLSIVHAIVTDHGGTITAASGGPGCGSRFVVTLGALADSP
jgi:two-component system NtrC family sensor kinase